MPRRDDGYPPSAIEIERAEAAILLVYLSNKLGRSDEVDER